ncbi:uncharacterized protein EV154DRAFT_479766 [Mucor mucedo]|uniref:uncharacterized protein n=1 Tax=Mucor mucedo TaxID=29922 RepID=UPI0022203140|nr:uncharacterized protein EV154DRAFT_479766 [Mucor mucedo]KAI7893097.1 hypothetical protein EV154DRAFT_479766 [Mucor mucedo]
MLFTATCCDHTPSKHDIIQIKVSKWTVEISLKLKQKRSKMKRNASTYTDTNTFDNYILKTVVIKLMGVSKQSSYNITQAIFNFSAALWKITDVLKMVLLYFKTSDSIVAKISVKVSNES